MANPLGTVARFTHLTIGKASDYFKKFDTIMKSGNMYNVTAIISNK